MPLSDPGDSPRSRRRRRWGRVLGWNVDPLTARLAAGIAALVVVPLVIGFHVLSDHHYDRTVAARRRSAEVQGRILESALLHQMMEEDATLMTSILEEIRDHPTVRGAMILNHEGEIRIASDAALVGRRVEQDSPSCIVCHSKDPEARERWTLLGEGDEQVLRTVLPIANRERCHRCHSPDKAFNGILILDTSLDDLHAEVRADQERFVAGAAGLGLLLVGGIGLFVRRMVLQRLDRLGRTARAITAGNLHERAASEGHDVIGSLAGDFNRMAARVDALITELRAQEAQLVSIMDSLDDGLVVLDSQSRVVAANRAFCRRVGSTPDAMRGHRCHDSLGPHLPCCTDQAECPASRCQVTGGVQRAVYRSGAEGDGTVEEVYASPVYDEDGHIVQTVEIWRDISERVAEEERLAEFEHLVALGTLASGFSHEVNTPLASVLTCAESAIAQIDRHTEEGANGEGLLPALRDHATVIREQVLRCRRITERFLRFSRGIPPTIEPLDLRQVVETVVSLVRGTARESGVTVEVEAAPALPAIRANDEVVQHALLNLLVNAIHSCEGRGGTISIGFAVEPEQVHIRIRDDGCGIEPGSLPLLFQPFHSRKPGGTGLGLFLSRSFMRRFGGDVRLVETEPGVGSCFEVSFARMGDARP